MPNSSRKTIFTTISIDKETEALVEKICKSYSLNKREVVKLACGYIDKAHINPSETPESDVYKRQLVECVNLFGLVVYYISMIAELLT